ncbi:MAG: OmpA family protein [Smithella sp.]|nr:OmpA family protein [Smithella sp.]
MKKIGILAVIIMLMAIVTAAQAEVRAGGLPPIDVNDSIKDCNCRLFPECCAQPVAAPTPAPKPTPVPAPVKEKVTITLNVQFDTNKAVIKEKYNDDIKKMADFMKEFPDTTAEIGGHTDNIASAAYNQKLSEKRANSVRQYLIDKFGIDGSRLTAVGYGLTKPAAGNDTEEGRQQNRRVEAVIKTVKN